MGQVWCKSFNTYWQPALLLLVAIIYLLVGGAIFSAVEEPHEQIQLKQIHLEKVCLGQSDSDGDKLDYRVKSFTHTYGNLQYVLLL